MSKRKELGVTPFWEFARRNLKIRNSYISGTIAEFLATGIAVMFAVGGSIQSIAAGYPPIYGVLGSAVGIMLAIYVAGGISGAHINPVMTLALAISGRVSWFKVPLFWFGQFLGAYVGAMLPAFTYWALIHDDLGEIIQTGGANYCYAFSYIGTVEIGTAIVEHIVMTTMLVITVLTFMDQENMRLPFYYLPFHVLMFATGNSLGFSLQTGAPVNPARDFSPRIAALTLGCPYDLIMTNGRQQWWLGSLFVPFVAAPVGAFLYIMVISAHVKKRDSGYHGDRQSARDLTSLQRQMIPPMPPPKPLRAPRLNDQTILV